jgi:hypothetical protein
MQPVPEDILKQFNAALEQKTVLSSLRDDYYEPEGVAEKCC